MAINLPLFIIRQLLIQTTLCNSIVQDTHGCHASPAHKKGENFHVHQKLNLTIILMSTINITHKQPLHRHLRTSFVLNVQVILGCQLANFLLPGGFSYLFIFLLFICTFLLKLGI
uniref:Putative ovule protein n=1 Tax=Solanum chacoense TaxID=4108 RepID=A0A0V0HEU2_SOLCH